MKTSRRNLLKLASIGSLCPSFSMIPRLLHAESSIPVITDRYFVFAYFSGAVQARISVNGSP